jgi:hypothetical protein
MHDIRAVRLEDVPHEATLPEVGACWQVQGVNLHPGITQGTKVRMFVPSWLDYANHVNLEPLTVVADREPPNHAFGPTRHTGRNNVDNREWVARDQIHSPLRGIYR